MLRDPGNRHLTDYMSFFYLFMISCLQMCGRITGLFPDVRDRKDQCWGNSNPHFSCLGADVWTLPGNADLQLLVCKHSEEHLAERGPRCGGGIPVFVSGPMSYFSTVIVSSL